MSNKGYPIEGRRENLESQEINLQAKHNTFTQLGVNKYGMDVFPQGVYEVQAAVVVGVGSTSSRLVVAGHSIRKGDIIEFVSTANSIQELFAQVWDVVDVDTVVLAGDLSADLTSGDTFNLLRPIYTRLAPNGASLATLTAGPIRIQRGASGVYSLTEITKDTADSNNTIPLPIEIVSSSGTEINITAGDLNVQLSATGVNYDSTRIGDGTNELEITASGEALVKDTDIELAVQAVGAQLPATLGAKLSTASLSVVLASDQAAIDVNNIGGTISLPTGAATAANQALVVGELQDIETDVEAAVTQLIALNAKDFATQTTLAAINTKTPSLGQANEAGSTPVTLTTAQASHLADIDTATTALAAEITASGLKVDIQTIAGIATEATLVALSAKLPATLGQKTSADSLAVVLASDQTPVELASPKVVAFDRVDFSVSNVTDAAYVAFETNSPEIYKAARFFYAGGQPIYLAIGAIASEVDVFMIPPGADFEIRLSDIAAGSRISLKAVNATTTISSGQLIINWLG